jgi:hypothetical protein
MARPSKQTPDVQTRICAAVRLGATFEMASHAAGVSYDTMHRMMTSEPEFGAAVKRAEAEGALVWLRKIERAATDGEWRAAAFLLERRYPQHYGKSVQQQEHSGDVHITVEHVDGTAWRPGPHRAAAMGTDEDS